MEQIYKNTLYDCSPDIDNPVAFEMEKHGLLPAYWEGLRKLKKYVLGELLQYDGVFLLTLMTSKWRSIV